MKRLGKKLLNFCTEYCVTKSGLYERMTKKIGKFQNVNMETYEQNQLDVRYILRGSAEEREQNIYSLIK